MTDTHDRDGRIHLYYGPGKGKTTAALGTALRAAGHDWSVAVIQFFKGSESLGQPYGERTLLSDLPTVTLKQYPLDRHVTHDTSLTTEEQATIEAGISAVSDRLAGDAEMVIADEMTLLWAFGYISTDRLCEVCMEAENNTELLITGRKAPEALVNRADYVTYMDAVKHPYQDGADPVAGVEY